MDITGDGGDNKLTGTSNADTILGLDGNDTLIGLGANDTLEGGNGDDKITPGSGNDYVDGGAGTDIVLFADALADCTITYGLEAITVVTKTEGTDWLVNVETLSFAGTVVPVPIDTTPPTATITDAIAGVARLPITYKVTFSEDVKGLTASDFTVSSGGAIWTVAGSGKDYTVEVAANDFEGNIVLSLNAGAVQDRGGNTNAAVSAAPQAFDTLRPTIVAVSPVLNASGVGVNSDIVITLSEPAKRGIGPIKLINHLGQTVETFDAATSSRITISGSTVTIDPTATLKANTGYYIQASGDAFTDLAGNEFPSINNVGTIAFSTGAGSPSRVFAATGLVTTIGGPATIFGTKGFQDVSVLDASGEVTFDPSFNTGGDVIRLQGNANTYQIEKVGSTAVLYGHGNTISVPLSTIGIPLVFADGVRKLVFDSETGQTKIGSQIVQLPVMPITWPTDGTVLPAGANPAATGRVYLGDGADVSARGNLSVFGTNGSEHLEVLGGNILLDPSFNRGGDVVELAGAPQTYTAQQSGSSVIIKGAEATVTIPVGQAGMTIDFHGAERTLYLDAGAIKIDNQIITTTPAVLG